MLEQLIRQQCVILLAGERGRLLDKLFCGTVQVLLARLVDEDLVDGLPEEALVEAAHAVFLVRLVNYLDEVALLKQSDRFFDPLGVAPTLR